MPLEPEFALRVQVSQTVRLPSHLKLVGDEYKQLARTQLLDAGQSVAIQAHSFISPAVQQLAKGVVHCI